MSLLLRILVSAAFLGLVLWHVDWQEVTTALARAQWVWLSLAFVGFNGSMVLASRRWQLITSAIETGRDRLTLTAAIAATYISLWLSNFLPTAFGGDVARVLAGRRAGIRLPLALATAVLDRYVGLTTLGVLFFLVEAFLAGTGRVRPLLTVASLFAAGFVVVFVMLYKGAHFPLRRRRLRSSSIRFLARAAGVLRALGAKPALSGKVAATSVAATLLGVMAYWASIRCVSAEVDLPTALAAAALGTVASAIPISVSGWGVREGTVALVVSASGALSASDGSLVAILNAVVIAATSLVGLGVSLTVGWQWKPTENGSGAAQAHAERNQGA